MKKVEKTPETAAVAAEPPVVELNSLAPPFVARGSTVAVDNKILLRHVGQATVVYNTVRANLKPTQHAVFDDVMFELRSAGRKIVRVDNQSQFSDGPAQFARLLGAEASSALQEMQALGLQLSAEETASLQTFGGLRDRILVFFKEFAPKYQQQGVKGDERPLVVNGSEVSNGAHRITVQQAKKIWARAYRVWGLQEADQRCGHIVHDYSRRNIEIRPTGISIGCQTVSRWQAETLAAEMGWID